MDEFIEDVEIVLDNKPPSPGFQKINVDLNMGVGGAFIHLCYKRGSNPVSALKGLIIIIDKQPTPVGHTKIDIDLNRGADGKFLFLCYSKIPVGSPALVDLGVLAWRKDNQPPLPSPEWKWLDTDLNMGAGGFFIKIIYRLEQ